MGRECPKLDPQPAPAATLLRETCAECGEDIIEFNDAVMVKVWAGDDDDARRVALGPYHRKCSPKGVS